MVDIDRTDAENKYADLIVKHGNPHYFVFKVIANWDNDELAESIAEMQKHVDPTDTTEYNIVDED